MKVLIIGVGYVGLVSGTCFAEMGHQVICLDIDQEKIRSLEEGKIPIYEPGLEEMVKRNLQAGRLSFTSDYATSIPFADVCFIAVDTPTAPNGKANTSQVECVARDIGRYLQHYSVIVTKSTVPVGTTYKVGEMIKEELEKRQVSIEFDIVSNPEFLKEGNAIQDFMKPDRVIIGIEHPRSQAIMKEVYSPFMFNHDRLLMMDIYSAELAKYASNAMLATRISFMNEIASLCEKIGANVQWVRKALGTDERIGNKFLYPGVGFGGSCLPKDIQALIEQARENDVELTILQAVKAVNEEQKKIMGSKIAAYFADRGGLKDKVIGILGLSFKPDTDDMREAPSIVLIQDLLKQSVCLRLFDPIAMPKAKSYFNHASICFCESELEAATGADALVLMTEWKQFRLLDFPLLLKSMRGCAFFDGRNQYQIEEMSAKGFDYISIGRQAGFANRHQAEESKTSQLILNTRSRK